MSSVTSDLDVTVASHWRRNLCGVSQGQGDSLAKSHWRTRVSHYHATKEVLDDPTIPFARQEIVVRARLRSGDSRRGNGDSTFYTVVGPKAHRSLLAAYRDGDGPAGSVAALYEQYSVPEQLVNETKVWSYWEHRKGWLTQLRAVDDLTRRVATTCLVRVLADWAAGEPALAGYLACSPPMAAVEDLLVIWAADASTAPAAESLLRDVIELALGPLGATTDGVLRAVMPRLYRHLPHVSGPPGKPDPVSALSGAAFDAIQAIQALPPEVRRQSLDEALTVLADTIAELADPAVTHG